MINDNDVVELDDGDKEAIIKRIGLNGNQYVLCQKVIKDELTMSFDIFKLDNDEFIDCDDEEKKNIISVLLKETNGITKEQLNVIIRLIRNNS